MNSQEHRVWWGRVATRFPTGRRLPAPLCLAAVLVILVAQGPVCELHGESSPAPEDGQSTSDTGDFPALAAAYRPIDRFIIGDTVLVAKGVQASEQNPPRSCDPIPAGSRIIAFEENSRFLCATGDASHVVHTRQHVQNNKGRPAFVRRFLFLKPSVFVVDDVLRQTASDWSPRWRVYYRSAPRVAGCRLRIGDTDEELVCETLWPVAAMPQKVPVAPKASEFTYQIELEPEAGADEVRCLRVFQLRRADQDGAAAESVLENNNGCLELAITTAERTVRLSLPPPGVDAGRIAVQAADGKAIVPPRPLPAGVLPHGPQGIRLIERWDRGYRDGRRPPWDTGTPAQDLKETVEAGIVRPCRTVVLGCGSGTNAIYLAGKGFDVTAIDIAPTALGIAKAKAKKAGVRVRWLLADVLRLPELEPFDFIFDRGCYHNVRYVDAGAFVESVRRLSHPGTRFLVLSLNRDGPPGVREHHMRDDFSSLFEFQWLRGSGIRTGKEGKTRRVSWSAMLRRKE